MPTADHREVTRLARKIGKVRHAQMSIADRRALAIDIPALLKAVGSHPPPMLPTADML
jgi:hypothetical protein